MTKQYVRDLAERVVMTFAAGALGILGANGADLTSLSLWQGAGLAGLVAVVSLLKGLVARYVGDRESAGL